MQTYIRRILRNREMVVHCLGAIFIIAIIWCFGIKTPAYSIYVEGNQKFMVEDSNDITVVLEQMQNADVWNQVVVKRTLASRSELLPTAKVAEELTLALQPKTVAASIVVNGQPAVSLVNSAVAEAMLRQLKVSNTPLVPGEEILAVNFEQQVEVVEGEVPTDKVLAWNDAWNMIKLGTCVPQTYTVQPGDNLWTIARKNDMYVSDITQANNLPEDSTLALGQQIILNKPQPLITVVAQVQGCETVPIPYQTQNLTDNSIMGIQVRTEGQNGERQVVYTATIRNGEMESKQVSEDKVTKAAVDRVVVKGTRATYQVASRGSGGSGKLDWPLYGTISQPFGGRHTGLDIAGSTGTPIVAADGGTVSFAGWQGGYGNFVIVDHGNGLVTRYAHCSSIKVKAGQQVGQGQTIATRGSTGNSTGPHLHFEVLQNGSFRNPISYLR